MLSTIGEGPSRDLLCDYEHLDGPSFQALIATPNYFRSPALYRCDNLLIAAKNKTREAATAITYLKEINCHNIEHLHNLHRSSFYHIEKMFSFEL